MCEHPISWKAIFGLCQIRGTRSQQKHIKMTRAVQQLHSQTKKPFLTPCVLYGGWYCKTICSQLHYNIKKEIF